MKSKESPTEKPKFKVIIAGSRTFERYDLLKTKLNRILANVVDEIVIVSGTAKGADRLGEKYAYEMGYEIIKFPAKWNVHGNSAGYIRNKEMAKCADALVAFWDGNSRGTKHMINIANDMNLKTRVILF